MVRSPRQIALMRPLECTLNLDCKVNSVIVGLNIVFNVLKIIRRL